MTRVWLLAVILAVPLPARAGSLFDPIDVRKRADLGDARIEKRVVTVETITPQRREDYRRAAATDQRATPGGVLERAPSIEQPRVERKLADRSQRVAFEFWPRQNFVPRHGMVATEKVPTTTRPVSRAEINERVIRTGSAAGQEELKEQLRKPH